MRIIVAVFTFGDRCSTNWAIPLNIWSLQMNTCHLQGLWYHRHAVLSSIFQHKNANLNKNSVFSVWDARQLHFIIRDITCMKAYLRTWVTWSLTDARVCWISHVLKKIFQWLRCGWVLRSKNVYPGGISTRCPFYCTPFRLLLIMRVPKLTKWTPYFFEFRWILTNACGIVVVTKKGGCFNETRIIR